MGTKIAGGWVFMVKSLELVCRVKMNAGRFQTICFQITLGTLYTSPEKVSYLIVTEFIMSRPSLILTNKSLMAQFPPSKTVNELSSNAMMIIRLINRITILKQPSQLAKT